MSKLPGVTTQNILKLMKKGQSLPHMLTMSLDDLKNITGNSKDAQALYNALHSKLKPTNEKSNFKPQGFRATIGRKKFKNSNTK